MASWLVNSFVLTLLAFMALVEFTLPGLGLEVTLAAAALKRGEETPPGLKLSTHLKGTPWHTFALLALWVWCGWKLLKMHHERRKEEGNE